MSKTAKQNRPKARLPKGLRDIEAAEIRGIKQMLRTIEAVYESYGFEPVETPMIEYTEALGKFLPDQDRPGEGVFSFQDDDEQWLSLRYDLDGAARPLRGGELSGSAQAPPLVSFRVGVPQRKAGSRALSPVHAVRRRHGRHREPGGGRRNLHAGGRYAGGAGAEGPVCYQGQFPQDS
jgi:hypothetical protein